MPKVRDGYRDVMRDLLLDAASAVLERKGVAHTTVRDILAEADVAPGTLYSYFSGKAEVLEALGERALSTWLAWLQASDDTWTADRLFAAMLKVAFGGAIPQSSLVAEFRGTPADERHAEFVKRLNSSMVASIRPFAQRLRDEDALDVEDTDAFVELLDIVWDGLSRRAATDTFVTDYERVGGLFTELLLRGALRPHVEVPRPRRSRS